MSRPNKATVGPSYAEAAPIGRYGPVAPSSRRSVGNTSESSVTPTFSSETTNTCCNSVVKIERPHFSGPITSLGPVVGSWARYHLHLVVVAEWSR